MDTQNSKKKKVGRPSRPTDIKCPNPNCLDNNVIFYGKRETNYGGDNQKYRCNSCGKIFSEKKKFDAELIYNVWVSEGMFNTPIDMAERSVKRYSDSIPISFLTDKINFSMFIASTVRLIFRLEAFVFGGLILYV